MTFLAAIPALASAVLRRAADTVFPPRCYACTALTGGLDGLCADCWKNVDFISAPYCARCGTPFPHEMGAKQVECMACLQTPPLFAQARSVFCYNEHSRRLITSYKYHDRTHATPMFGQWLHRAAGDIAPQTDLIVPVPLHRWRLLHRRYNQSALLAASLSRRCGKPLLGDGLRRIRHTAQQAGLTRDERLRNVDGAFTVPEKRREQIEGKHLLLVDDVLTTGATLNACTKALLEAGAKSVCLLTLARTVGEEL